jgi:hypothetical protein
MTDNPLPQPSRDEALNDETPVEDEHPPTEKQLKTLMKKDGKLPGHYGADAELAARINQAEEALLALVEFGDRPGHPFRGNQHGVTLKGADLNQARAIVKTIETHAGVSQAAATGHQELKDTLAAGRSLNPKQIDGLKNYESYVRRQLGVSQVTGPAHDSLLKALSTPSPESRAQAEAAEADWAAGLRRPIDQTTKIGDKSIGEILRATDPERKGWTKTVDDKLPSR